MPIEGLDRFRKIAKNIQRLTAKDILEPSLREAVKTLHRSVTSELPASGRGRISKDRTGISGEVPYGLKPGVLRRGLGRGFKVFAREVEKRFTEAVFGWFFFGITFSPDFQLGFFCGALVVAIEVCVLVWLIRRSQK